MKTKAEKDSRSRARGQKSPVGSGAIVDPSDSGSSPLALSIERHGLFLAFGLYVIVQVNAALHHGALGQDAAYHAQLAMQAVHDPWRVICTVTGWQTNPPLYYLALSRLIVLCRGIHALEVIGLFNIAINLLGLVLLSRLLRRLIADPVLRLACMILLLFLPFAMIHAVTMACDAPATALFLIAAWFFVRMTEETRPIRIFAMGAGACVVLLLGLGTKFTFISLAATAPIIIGMTAWTNRWPRKKVIAMLAVGLVPLAAGAAELYVYRDAIKSSHFQGTGGMSLRSLLFVRSGDGHILDAPPYNETVTTSEPRKTLPPTGDWFAQPGTEFNLIAPDRYSYPALLHLTMFTDCVNVFQYDPTDKYFGPRSQDNQACMALAVQTGLLFSLGALLAVPIVAVKTIRAVWKRREVKAAQILVGLLMAMAFYLNIVAFLPVTPGAYGGGYWLPRLVVPSLLVFFACIFIALDWLSAETRNVVRWLALAAAIFQSIVHVSFLWPWGP